MMTNKEIKVEVESFLRNSIKDPDLQRRALHLMNNMFQYVELDTVKSERTLEVKELEKKNKSEAAAKPARTAKKTN